MRSRMKQITGLIILAGASALGGCASVQTPHEYAYANGYRPIEIQGTEYFCRREQPAVPGSPLVGVKCLTAAQFRDLVARVNYADLGITGPQQPHNFDFTLAEPITPGPDIFATGRGPTLWSPH